MLSFFACHACKVTAARTRLYDTIPNKTCRSKTQPPISCHPPPPTRPARASCPEAELKKKREELSEEKRKKEQIVIANRCLMQQLAKARKELGQEVLGPFVLMLESFLRRHAEH